jgi:hypothetical protein
VAKATKSKKNEEGRRVGHDFYDLLIEEALVDPNEQGFKRYRLLTTAILRVLLPVSFVGVQPRKNFLFLLLYL